MKNLFTISLLAAVSVSTAAFSQGAGGARKAPTRSNTTVAPAVSGTQTGTANAARQSAIPGSSTIGHTGQGSIDAAVRQGTINQAGEGFVSDTQGNGNTTLSAQEAAQARAAMSDNNIISKVNAAHAELLSQVNEVNEAQEAALEQQVKEVGTWKATPATRFADVLADGAAEAKVMSEEGQSVTVGKALSATTRKSGNCGQVKGACPAMAGLLNCSI